MYEEHLGIAGIELSDFVFEEFLKEDGKNVCPQHGDITYVDEKVKCSVHTIVDNDGKFHFYDQMVGAK